MITTPAILPLGIIKYHVLAVVVVDHDDPNQEADHMDWYYVAGSDVTPGARLMRTTNYHSTSPGLVLGDCLEWTSQGWNTTTCFPLDNYLGSTAYWTPQEGVGLDCLQRPKPLLIRHQQTREMDLLRDLFQAVHCLSTVRAQVLESIIGMGYWKDGRDHQMRQTIIWAFDASKVSKSCVAAIYLLTLIWEVEKWRWQPRTKRCRRSNQCGWL